MIIFISSGATDRCEMDGLMLDMFYPCNRYSVFTSKRGTD
jgi:hypothetical protein